MTGFDSDFTRDVNHDVGHSVGQIVEGAVKAICGAEIASVVQVLLDAGALRPESEDWAVCRNNHAYERSLSSCPRCGDDGNESQESLDSPDSEIDRDEDRPASGPDEAEDETPRAEVGLEERIQAFLIKAGVPSAGEVAQCLAALWAKGTPPSAESLASEFAGLVEVDEAVPRSLADRLLFSLQPAEEAVPPPTAHLRVIYDMDWKNLRCEAINPLDGYVVTGKAGVAVNRDGIDISASRICRWLNTDMLKILEGVGGALIAHRGDFFFAKTRSDANRVLVDKPLTQKAVAEELGMSPTTLNRFCLRGVQVHTVHGVVPLSAFFKKEAQTALDQKRTRQAVIEALAAEFRQHPALQGMGWKEIRPRLHEWNLEMKERTWRNYKNEIQRILDADVLPVDRHQRQGDRTDLELPTNDG